MIDVYRVQRNGSPGRDAAFPCLVLEEDSWNDFGYFTLFHARWCKSFGHSMALGDTKILQKGETQTAIPQHFNALTAEFCSLGQTLSYYEEIHDLGSSLQEQILRALRDIVAHPQIANAFESEKGFQSSLLRTSEAEQAFREGAKILRESPLGRSERIEFSYSVKLKDASSPHQVTLGFGGHDLLPCRIVGFIGKNGTGKTWILSRLAADISGDEEREGRFQPGRPQFGRVIAVSYNALDKFRRPPKSDQRFSYKYCGIYDASGNVVPRSELLNRLALSYRELAEKRREQQWRRFLTNVFGKGFTANCTDALRTNEPVEGLDRLSSGQMIFVTVVTELLAAIDRNSLILYDEPELHLHPNAISSLMRSMANLLEAFDSYAIVATHSPLVIQQIPAAYVRVFTRVANQTFIGELSDESFGESLSVLTEDIFQVNTAETLFRSWLNAVPRRTSEKQILNAFTKGLSFRAKSVIRTVLAANRRKGKK
jgi:predicted ATPase